ncbi:MAG: dihydroxyacetone kinase subunit DhaL [Anaerolineae bacterium]
MGKSELSLQETQAMLINLADRIIASKELLTQADRAIGDGDHGVGMARGFEAVRSKLANMTITSLDEAFKVVGTALMTSVGGAAGAVFGTFFRAGARQLGGRQVFDSEALALMLSDGLDAVKARGKAEPGDKTMLDALAPAARQAQALASAPLDQCLIAVANAAREGMEATQDMVARAGKARSLGERSLGHPDPGAVSTYLILKFMMEYVAGD